MTSFMTTRHEGSWFVLVVCVVLSWCTTHAMYPTREGHCGPTNKIYYSETVLPSTQIDDGQVLFVSGDNQIIFVRTLDGQVYRSGDEGKTWEKQTVNSKMSFVEDLKEGISAIFHNQVQDKTISIFFISYGNTNYWVSNNGGRNYTFYNSLPPNIFALIPHPTYPNLILGRKSVGATHELWLGDHGTSEPSWKRLLTNVPQHGAVTWSKFPNTDPKRIYSMHVGNNGNELLFSDDFFASTTVLPLPRVFSWTHIEPDKLVVVVCADSTCNTKKMYLSQDAGSNFKVGVFPDSRRDTPEESNFYVFELTDGAVWTRVQRACDMSTDICWGDMYHTATADKAFTLSLPYLRYWDFTKYDGVDGIYIANQYNTGGSAPEYGDAVRSLITFDKGSAWSLLRPPLVDSKHQPYLDNDGTACVVEKGCSLHVHGWSGPNIFTYFYSIPNAVGLMIASGNVGRRLEERGDDINLFVSSNGGSNWTEVREGVWVPEIGDHGSIITLVDGTKPSEEVVYNIGNPEELADWHTCKFTPTSDPPLPGPSPYAILGRNIRVSEGWDSTRFIMYGQRRNSTTGGYNAVIVHLNFDEEFSGKCTDSQFEAFTPKDLHGNCVLGVAKTYLRKARTATCYYGEDHEKNVTQTPCECQLEDYECDHCFMRPTLGAPCQLQCIGANQNGSGLPPDPPLCANASLTNPIFFLAENIGYRKVDGDKCDPRLPNSETPKAKIPCKFAASVTPVPPPKLPTYSITSDPLPVIIVAIVLVFLIVGVFYYLWKKHEPFYTWVAYNFGIDDPRVMKYAHAEPGESLAVEVDAGTEEKKGGKKKQKEISLDETEVTKDNEDDDEF